MRGSTRVAERIGELLFLLLTVLRDKKTDGPVYHAVSLILPPLSGFGALTPIPLNDAFYAFSKCHEVFTNQWVFDKLSPT